MKQRESNIALKILQTILPQILDIVAVAIKNPVSNKSDEIVWNQLFHRISFANCFVANISCLPSSICFFLDSSLCIKNSKEFNKTNMCNVKK